MSKNKQEKALLDAQCRQFMNRQTNTFLQHLAQTKRHDKRSR